MDSFEITLFKDSNGNQIHLNELTLDASLQIKEVLDSLIQIVKFENETNGLNLKLSIENCCAAFKIQGEETEMEIVHKKITDVFEDTDERINEYVNPLKIIKDNILSDSTSEVKFLKRGNVLYIRPKFSNNFRSRKK